MSRAIVVACNSQINAEIIKMNILQGMGASTLDMSLSIVAYKSAKAFSTFRNFSSLNRPKQQKSSRFLLENGCFSGCGDRI